ncbi:MAG TPA: HD-GYP domain-containing protein [Gaiellaceae bacterium]
MRRLPALADLVEEAGRVDPSFCGHAVHVLSLSVRIARALGLAKAEVRPLAVAAALHDVGKLRVGASILAKPGPLDDTEWAAVRAHPADGEQLLASFVPRNVLRIVRSHHERWDATGYPDRLAGDEIPLGARIVAVADAYAAMIEQRAYRRPRSKSAARAELRRQRGRQFDPACVDAALRVTRV